MTNLRCHRRLAGALPADRSTTSRSSGRIGLQPRSVRGGSERRLQRVRARPGGPWHGTSKAVDSVRLRAGARKKVVCSSPADLAPTLRTLVAIVQLDPRRPSHRPRPDGIRLLTSNQTASVRLTPGALRASGAVPRKFHTLEKPLGSTPWARNPDDAWSEAAPIKPRTRFDSARRDRSFAVWYGSGSTLRRSGSDSRNSDDRGTRSLGEPQLDTLTQASSILASRTELLDGPVDRCPLIRGMAAFNSQ